MRTLVALLFALAFPLLAQAGEDCPYSKQATTTAAVEAPVAPVAHHETCPASCPHAVAHEKSEKGKCACGHAAELRTAAEAAPRSSETPVDSTTVATTD